jgi:hypothetical protein
MRTELGRLEGHTNTVLSVGWSPDGTRLVSGSADGTIRVWDPDDGTALGRLDGHTARVRSVGVVTPMAPGWFPGRPMGPSGSGDPDERTELGRLEDHTNTGVVGGVVTRWHQAGFRVGRW